MSAAYAEITGAVVRVYNGSTCPPSPFDYVLTVVGDEGTAIIKGLRVEAGGFGTAARVAIFAELRRLGFRRVMWRRYRAGVARVVEASL